MKKIQELIEAGKKATQGDFTLEKLKPDDGFDEYLMTFGGCLKTGKFEYSVWQTGKGKDAEFLARAANARTEIETLYTLAQEMAEALEQVMWFLEKKLDDPSRMKDIKDVCEGKQALTKWTEFMK